MGEPSNVKVKNHSSELRSSQGNRSLADAAFHEAITPQEEPTDPPRECPYCRRICSVREWLEQHACNDCYGNFP